MRAIVDRPTQLHFSPLRGNVLAPLRLGPGCRVLDVHARTGAVTRAAAETGADVVALEPHPASADAIEARCADLANVEVVRADIEGFDDRTAFDVVLGIGILDTATRHGNTSVGLLDRLRSLLARDGVLAVAVANPVNDANPGTRDAFAELLRSCGLGAQAWFSAFPDHLLASRVLSDALYASGDADRLDQLIGWACDEPQPDRRGRSDARHAHRLRLDVGSGRNVASSFLVVCAPEPASLRGRVDPTSSAWLFNNHRRREWSYGRRITTDGRVETLDATAWSHTEGWLTLETRPSRHYIPGRTIEQLALEASRADERALAAVIERWDRHLAGVERPRRDLGSDLRPAHPFWSQQTTRVLPPDHVDVVFANFVVTSEGGLRYIDDEVVVDGGVDGDLARFRALWHFAREIVIHGVPHPFGSSATVDEIADRLATHCDPPLTTGVEQLLDTDPRLHAIVGIADAPAVRAFLAHAGTRSIDDPS